MKTLFTSVIIALLTAPLTLSQSFPKIVNQASQTVDDAVQAKRTVDQYKKEATSEKRKEKEDYYNAIQEKEAIKDKLTELKGAYLELDHRIELVENANKEIESENDRLIKRVYALEQEKERLTKENETYKLSFSDVISRLNRLELASAEAFDRATVPSVAPSKPSEVRSIISSTPNTVHSNSVPTTNSNYEPVIRSNYTPKRTYTLRSSQQYFTGPRGGCFYYTSSGRKEYVDRSLCK